MGDQVPEMRLLQDWMGTALGGVDPNAVGLPVIF